PSRSSALRPGERARGAASGPRLDRRSALAGATPPLFVVAVTLHSLSRRASGILLHPTSLPGAHGIGDLGSEAHRFAGWLETAGQSWWQMLPNGPLGFGNSPYSALSAFAGNPLLISLQALAEEGLVGARDLKRAPRLVAKRADYPRARAVRDS